MRMGSMLVAVVLGAIGSVACGAGASSGPAELPTEPDTASSVAKKTGGQQDEGDPPLEESPGTGTGTDEEEPSSSDPPPPAADAGPPPSTSPLCAKDLTCSSSSIKGASGCKQEATSTTDIFCCPKPGDRIENGKCVAPPVCGTGLTCAGYLVQGAASCRQDATSTTAIWCCPKVGAKIVNGKCQ